MIEDEKIKTTEEWTVERVRQLLATRIGGGYEQLVDAHKAALAAKDHEWNLARLTDIKELTDKHAQQLAAEQESHSKTAKQFVDMKAYADAIEIKLAAAKPKTTEYAQGWDDHVLAAKSQREELEQKVERLQNLLRSMPKSFGITEKDLK